MVPCFSDLDWPLNASRGLSALAEFLVLMMYLSCMRREIRAYPSVKSRLGGVFCGVYFLGKCGTNFWSIA